MVLEIILILIFVIINGFFAASEIAVVTIRKSRIKKLIEEEKANAKTLYDLRHNPDKFLATIQFGVTCAGAIASAIGGAAAVNEIKPILQNVPIPLIAGSSEPIAITLIVLFVTYVSIIFGELIPKSIALANPEGTALFVAPFISVFSKIAGLFVKLFSFSTNLILKPFGKKSFTERAYVSEEEVRLLIEEGGEQGVFEQEERDLIHSVFEFTDTFVKEVMIPAPQMVTIKSNMTLDEIKEIIVEEKFSRYPVIGDDINDVKGILYAKDFYNSLLKTGTVILRKVIKPPLFIPETMKISNLMREMQKKRFHMAIVVDEYGGVSGLVTMEDLLEEIVGEIRDEYDTESPVILLNDGSMIIDAAMSIADLKEDYHIPLEESSEYESIAGFILTYLQRIPAKGDIIEHDGIRLKIIEMTGQRIVKVKLEKIKEEGLEKDKNE